MSTRFKEIVYRGGLVTFRIPADWVEEYQAEGGGTFYRDAPDSGTLRLNVLTMERDPGSQSGHDPVDVLAKLSTRAPAPTVERISPSVALRRYRSTTEEKGVGLAMWRWEVCQVVTRTTVRLIMFAYAVTLHEENDLRNVEERRFLDRAIPEASYATARGA